MGQEKTPTSLDGTEKVSIRLMAKDTRAAEDLSFEFQPGVPITVTDILREAVHLGLPLVAQKYRTMIGSLPALPKKK